MTKMEYAEAIATKVNGSVVELQKNGVVQTGVNVPIDERIMGTFYIDNLYEKELPIDEATEMALKACDKSPIDLGTLLDNIYDYDKIKSKLRFRMYSAYNGQSYDLCYSAERFGFKDLILVPVYCAKGYSFMLHRTHVDMWGIDDEQLFEDCYTGTINDVRVESLLDMLSRVYGIEEDYPIEMIIVSNSDGNFGASAIIGAKPKLEEIFPDGYVVIPSSIHEVIAIPIIDNMDEVDNLIKLVNNTEVNQQDWLSCHKYVFR